MSEHLSNTNKLPMSIRRFCAMVYLNGYSFLFLFVFLFLPTFFLLLLNSPIIYRIGLQDGGGYNSGSNFCCFKIGVNGACSAPSVAILQNLLQEMAVP